MLGDENYGVTPRKSQRTVSRSRPYPSRLLEENKSSLNTKFTELSLLLQQEPLNFTAIDKWVKKITFTKLGELYDEKPHWQRLLEDARLKRYWDYYLKKHSTVVPEPGKESLSLLLGYDYYYGQAYLYLQEFEENDTNKNIGYRMLEKGYAMGSIHCCRDLLSTKIYTYKNEAMTIQLPIKTLEELQGCMKLYNTTLNEGKMLIEPFKEYYPLCYFIFLARFYKAMAEMIPGHKYFIDEKKARFTAAYGHYLVSQLLIDDKEFFNEFKPRYKNIFSANYFSELKVFFEKIDKQMIITQDAKYFSQSIILDIHASLNNTKTSLRS